MEAAGGVVSNAVDMKLWMAMQLRDGKLANGTELMPAKYLKDMFSPHCHMPLAMEVEPVFPVLDSVDHVGLAPRCRFFHFTPLQLADLSALNRMLSPSG